MTKNETCRYKAPPGVNGVRNKNTKYTDTSSNVTIVKGKDEI